MKKYIVWFVVFAFMFFGYACGDGGGSISTSNQPVIYNITTSSTSVSKTNLDNVTFSWDVSPSSYDKQYYVDIYLSKTSNTTREDAGSILIASKICTTPNDSLTLTPDSEGYQKILDTYGGIYYLVFDIYEYRDGVRIDTVQSISNFIVKNIWTVMVYMDGDNSLSDATYADLDEMQETGSDSYVGVVVQDDTSTDPAKRYFIEKNSIDYISDIGEVDMGDYNTLIDFVKWAASNYPADHYLLVLWDHGKGFEDVKSTSKITKDILWDDNPIPGSSMSIPNLSKALLEINAIIGKKIDIVGMDACLMNMLEVAYGMRNYAEYMVGSETTEPGDGWPYDTILQNIEENETTITPKEVAMDIVQNYIDSYSDNDYPTQSAINLNNIDNLTNVVNVLANALINGINNDATGKIATTLKEKGYIFNSVQRFDENGDGYLNPLDNYADLYNLAQLISQNDNMTTAIQNAANNVLDAFNDVVVLSGYKGAALENSHGLSIWFPTYENYIDYAQYYDNLSFAKNTEWEDLINLMYK